MNSYAVQHLLRAWRRHWVLQAASVTVMTLVLVLLNFLFLGYSAFNKTIDQWGRGLEMIVYLKEGTPQATLDSFRGTLEKSGEFEQIQFTPKEEATKKFLSALGPESLDLLKDPKWSSPIPSSFELRLSGIIPVESRVQALSSWSAKIKGLEFIDDVFYGQGWVENFTHFLTSARGVLFVMWVLSLSVGLLIISNCIRLSFWQRKDEIEILELVGASTQFVRTPFLLEGAVLGAVASVLSLAISFGLHSALLSWMGKSWSFWLAFDQMQSLEVWAIGANIITAMAFGFLGAWNCVRKLNTGWSAAVG